MPQQNTTPVSPVASGFPTSQSFPSQSALNSGTLNNNQVSNIKSKKIISSYTTIKILFVKNLFFQITLFRFIHTTQQRLVIWFLGNLRL